MSSNESYPQYIVTAVIVAHDGAAWLPHVTDAVLDQTRPVQRVVAVDTGSRDRSGAVLASKFGQQAVFGMDRSTGYGAAIARALAHRAANTPIPGAGGPSGDRIEWLWLLHDDSEPAQDALEQLLRGAAETSAAAVLGPKLKDWTHRDVISEAGITLDTAARRVTGIEPREVDQGQHDGDRDTLAVCSAGMLVRRDVWEQVGGFDIGMGLLAEDIDFCWRVHAAGYRVRVITDAVVYHVQAATKHRRAVSVGRRVRMLDRRNGLLTLLGNLPFRQMLPSVLGNLAVSALRITFFLLAKRLAAAMDEASALAAVLCHPLRLMRMRRRRARGRNSAYARIRADLPPGRSTRRLAEFAASTLTKSQADTAGAHHASIDPADDDSLLTDNGLARRLLTSPSLLTCCVLTAVALAAGRSLIGGGPLGGGSLIPAWGGATDLWRTYVEAFHPVGVGSTSVAPAWLAVLAGLSTLLAGKPWLAIDVILIGCVPLAGMTAMLAARRVTTSKPVRVWVSVTYALLPVATGVVASGRFGSAVAFVLLPLIVLTAGRIFTASRQRANRAGWATGLLVAVAAAFVPLVWLIAVVACVLAAIALRNTRPGVLRNLAVVALTPPVLLLPWTFSLLGHPSDLLLEAGLPQQGTPVSGVPARALMLLSPGGPGLPPYWVTAGLLVAALAALFAGRRRAMITAGWGLALSGLLAAIVVSHLTVRPQDGGPVVVWAGLPLAIAALGLLLAAAVGTDGLARLRSGRKGVGALLSGRGLAAAVIAVLACSTPVLAAVSWLGSGVQGPVHKTGRQLVPELVAVADGQRHQVRTLVLRDTGGQVSYLLLRGPSPSLADASLTPSQSAQRALDAVVAELTSPDGGMAINQAKQLSAFDIGYVLVQAPVDGELARTLDGVNGLSTYSTTPTHSIWRLTTPPARVSLLEPGGTVVPVSSGSVGVSGARLPASGGILMLAEPASGWQASVNGHGLTQVPSPAGSWAEAFRVPRGGGVLDVRRPGLVHDLALLVELLAFLAIVGLALPGIHVAESDGQHAAPDAASAGRARRAAGSAPAAGDADDADDEDDEAAGAAPSRRGVAAGVAATSAGAAAVAARAASPRRVRGRAKGRKATKERGAAADRSDRSDRADRAGRGKPGRGRPSPPPGRRAGAAAGADRTGDDGHDRAPRPGRAWPFDGDGAPSGGDAWPHDLGGAAVGGDGRPYDLADGETRSYRAEEEAASRARGGRGDRSPGRALPVRAGEEPYGGVVDDRSFTGQRGRAYRDGGARRADDGRYAARAGEDGPAGRPSADRASSAGWPDELAGPAGPGREHGLDRDRDAAGRARPARSPSGGWPYPGDDRAGGQRDLAPGGDRAGAGPGRDYDDEDLGSGRHRSGRHGSGSARGYVPAAGRPNSPSGSWPSAGGDAGWDDIDGGRPGPGYREYGEDLRQDRDPGARDGGRRESRDRYPSPAGRGQPDHLGGRRPAEPADGWGRDDVLEPLPPIAGQGGSRGRRSAWSPAPAADDSGAWDQPPGPGRTSSRWSAPAADEADYEPDYEGDPW